MVHSLSLYLTAFVSFYVAVADVVRTSLGPRGMDKMVSLESSPHSGAQNIGDKRNAQKMAPC